MRYEDSSQAGAVSGQSDGQGPEARDDLDTLAAGARGPATGNVITGEGTQYGAASSDLSADHAAVTAVAGAGGQDSSFSGGKLAVTGEYGKLSIDAEGNYSYLANQGAPENSRDRFTYTLADKQGNSDTAALTIEIGKTPVVIQANAQQVVVGPDGVVVLPAGVQLSDIHVVGRNLVINLPDGTQMVIIDGAVFVPQLVLGTVEVPATNLAALLIDSEPRPAAGTPPPSGGGNFGLPPGPLDPGVPLGDLLPPTEMAYTPPDVREVNGILDRKPEISIDPGNGVPVENAVDSVNEAGLPARNEGEPQGSGEEAAAGANGDPSETTTGTIVYTSPDNPNTITIDGLGLGGPVVITAIGQVIQGQYGALTITSIADGAIGYSYTLADNTGGNNTSDPFTVVITDNDGDTDTATLTVNIVDDEPTARPDTDSIAAGAYGPATGNVITDAAAGDVGDSDTNPPDTVGTDNASVTQVASVNVPANVDNSFTAGNLVVNGQYGVLTIAANGSYSYVRNAGTPGGVNDVFNYTLTDGDGDAKVTTLTISIGDATPNTAPNPTALVDDDAVPLANGNPGGVGDDADAANLSGTLGASGGDGPLTYDLLLTGAPAGFTYVDGPNGSVLVQQGGTTVLTITVNATTGAYTVTQNAPIDHVALLDENNVAFTINYRVTDQDGDPADGTLNINVDDDTPTIGRADVSLPTLTVDETNLALNATGGVAALFQTSFGADGAGSVSYALTVVNGTDSGLVDVGTGLAVLLYNIGGVVTGSTSATLAGVTAGNTVFTASINANTGVVTLDQIRALDHPSNPNPNDPVSPTATSIQAVATVTDGDGDPVSLAVNIGSSFVFLDDGPSVDITLSATAEPVLLTQDTETDGTPTTQDSASASFAPNFTVNVNNGADGPGTQSVTYALGVSAPGVDSGLDQGGANIYLHLIGGVVVGSTSASAAGVNAGNTVFDVTVNAAGSVTLTQYSQIDHPIGSDPTATGAPFADHILSLTDSLVTLTATANVTDGDGDPASDSQVLNIGAQLQFADDGPDISAVLTGTLLKLDETDGVGVPGEIDPAGGNLGTITVAAASLITVSNANISADTPTTLAYSLVLSADGVASGLLLSTTNAPIYLYNIGGTITGSTSATLAGVNAGNTAFTVSINTGTGAVTMTQFLAVEHTNTASNDEDSSGLTAGVLSLRVTATDFDGDTDQASADLGSIIRFEDDGPTMNRADVSLPTLTVDETNLATNATGNVSVVFSGAYGSDGPGTTSYAVSTVNGTDSGLIDVATGLPVLLYNIGGVVTGSTSATLAGVTAGNTVFTVSIDANTGVVTLDQIRALDHPANPNPNDPVSPNATSIQAVATITDSDGDPASLAVNIGASLVFLDDGPAVDITLSGTGEPSLVTQDSETDGTPTSQDSASASFAANFTVNANGGADGIAAQTVTYALGVSAPGVDSGLDSGGASIFLYTIGGVVVGSTSATLAGVNAGNTVFNVTVDAGGTVTLTQFSQIDHPAGGDPSPTGSPFVDHIASLTDSLVTLTATATVTDGDGDPASDNQVLNIGAQLRFQDDGPDISAVLTGTQIRIDETDGVVAAGGEVDPAGGNLGTVTVAAATLFTVSNVNLSADTPTTLSYALVLSGQGVASGLLLSTTNAPIYLYLIGGVVTGSTSATLAGVNAGNTAFTATINPGTGAVTLTQFLAVEHFNTSSNDEDSSGLAANVLQVQVTATDFDGDTDQASVDLGSIIRFEDDGPTIDVSVDGQVTEPVLLTQDTETDGTPTTQDSASSAANFGGVFNLAFTTGSDGAATPTLAYALGVSAPGVDSGLDQGGANIYLHLIGGVVVGSTSASAAGVNAGNTVFDVTVSGTGVVTLTQYSQIDHPIAGDPTATGAPFADHILSLTDSLVTLTASSTITDNDGDPASDSATVNIGANLRFADDGPDVAAVLTGTLLKLDETDGVGVPGEVDPAGGNLGTITVAGATLVSVTQPNVSADTPTTLAYSLVLSADGVASGLLVSSNNAPIYLYNIGGTITGSTSATLAGVNAGNTAFTVSINTGTGAVTMTQFLAVEHSNTASNDEDSSGLAAGALSLRVTATDFDGDTDQASVDLGSIIRFEDDGPSATNDVDLIVGGVGPATGNVITGVDIVGGDANSTDGSADNIGSDTPGSITAVTSNNVPANVDTDPSANFTIAGQYGVLTLNANGNYSYLRNPATPGGVSDVFTYTLTDADGDSVTATLTIGIDDRFPAAGNVNVQIDDDDVAGAGGNPGGTGDDAPLNASGNLPGSGGDGALTWDLLLTGAPAGFSYVDGPAGSVYVFQGTTHVVTITLNASTGAYTVTQIAPIVHPAGLNENNVSFTVNYTVTDADLDSAPGTININVDDDTPTVDVSLSTAGEPTLITQDSETDGVPTAQDTASASFAANFTIAASDGADGPASPVVTYALGVSAPGVDSGLDQGGASIFLYLIGGVVVGSTSATQAGVTAGNTVFDVTVNAAGSVTLTQYSQIDHPAGGDPSPTGTPFTDHFATLADSLVTLTASATITDTDGDTATDSQVLNIGANLRFQDDGPDISAVLTGTQIRIDETDGVVAAGGEVDPVGGNLGTVTVSAATLFTVSNVNVSADTPTTLGYALVLSSQGVASGLLVSSNNAPIFLYDMGGGVIAGSTSATLIGVNAGNTAFTVSINTGTGAVTMTQFLAIEHGNTASVDEDSSGLAAGALSVRVTATDFDGDTDQASVDLGSVIRFEDDGPTLGVIQDQTASNNPASAVSTGTLHFAVGSDMPAVVTAISATNVGVITSGGFNLVTNVVGNVLTAYQDVNGNSTYEAGTDTTAVYTLTVNPAAGTSGQYVFDLITPLDPTVTDTPIGGSSSFGAGPTGFQQLNSATAQPLAIVSGYLEGAAFNEAAWLAGGPATGLTAGGVNGSTAGWGIDNNNFNTNAGDVDEFFNWDFGPQALDDPDGPGGFVPPANPGLPAISYATYEFIGYSTAAGDAISYVVHYVTAAGVAAGYASGTIPAVNINGAFWTHTAPAGLFIADIEMFSGPGGNNLGSGKVDLVSVGVQTANLTETINFNVTITDADGDPVSGGFSVNVADGNSPAPPAAMAVYGSTKVSSSSTLVAPTNDNDRLAANVQGNTGVVAGIVAASGLMAMPVAAEPMDLGMGQYDPLGLSAGGFSQQMVDRVSIDDFAGDSLSLGNELREPAFDVGGLASSSNGFDDFNLSDLGLADLPVGGNVQELAPALAIDQGPSFNFAAIAAFAPAVGMPAAEQLVAAGLTGENVQRGGSVEQVLADALGAGAAGTVDALLQSLPGQGLSGNAGVEALASPIADHVPAWDMGANGAFVPGADMMFRMDVAMLHHDAVQPVVNG